MRVNGNVGHAADATEGRNVGIAVAMVAGACTHLAISPSPAPALAPRTPEHTALEAGFGVSAVRAQPIAAIVARSCKSRQNHNNSGHFTCRKSLITCACVPIIATMINSHVPTELHM